MILAHHPVPTHPLHPLRHHHHRHHQAAPIHLVQAQVQVNPLTAVKNTTNLNHH